jgi:hypothetical protein
LVGSTAPRLAAGQNGHHFPVLPRPEINVIARMAPMTGIQ